MKLEDMQELIGQKVYALRVGQMHPWLSAPYAYRIYPVEMTIVEIRLGEARREADRDFYGPGFVTWLCQNSSGIGLYAFSPVGDEILGNTQAAGRNTRAFFNKDDLYQEAEILKELVLNKYKDVSRVDIGLPAQSKGIGEIVHDATVRAESGKATPAALRECSTLSHG